MKNQKRKQFVINLILLFWGLFPYAFKTAMMQRGKFAIGGEYCLFILPFVIAELIFTIEDLVKGTYSR